MEADLYPDVLEWLKLDFRQQLKWRQNSNFVATIVAELDWLAPSGRWMHPDLAFVHVHRRSFDPVATLDLYTFEVKTASADLLQALHQTLAHGRIADFVFLVAPEDGRWNGEIKAQALRFGVGLVSFSDPSDGRTYKTMVDAKRGNPDPDLRNQFLDAVLSDSKEKEEVQNWLRS